MQPSIYGPYTFLPITRRKRFQWPGGARLALWAIPNLEFFHLDDPTPGANNQRIPRAQAKIPDIRNWTMRDYGNRVGFWRMLDMLRRHDIRATAAVNSDMCEYHAEIIEAGVAANWEFMGHCQTNAVRLNEMQPEAEREAIHATLDRISAATGKRTVGWLGAGLAETWHTLDHLLDEGVEYVADWASDDLPFRMTLERGKIMSIPYTLQCNDTAQFFDQKATAEEFGDGIRRQFDQLYTEAAEIPRVMAIALHPFISGMPYRIGAVDAALRYIRTKPGVWFATGSEIVRYYAQAVPQD
jgi:peptidoglycan/xylan/chitin deacetylase (PgdA/CDA1 family)